MYQLTKADVGRELFCVPFASWHRTPKSGECAVVTDVRRKYATVVCGHREYDIDCKTGYKQGSECGSGLHVYETEQDYLNELITADQRLKVARCIRDKVRKISDETIAKIHAILIEDGVIEDD